MEHYYPLNVDGQIFYGYYNNDEEPIEEVVEELISDLKNGWLKMGKDCFHRWSEQIGDLNKNEEYCLYLGIIIQKNDRSSIKSLIKEYSIHDIEIILSKDLFYYSMIDDFGDERILIRLEDGVDTVENVQYILIRINPNYELDRRSRQIVSYMLGVIFRMLSLLEGHVYTYLQKIGDPENQDYSSDILTFLSVMNNYYVEEAPERAQLVCSSTTINKEILLKLNDINLIKELFEDYPLSVKPSQTSIIMQIKGK